MILSDLLGVAVHASHDGPAARLGWVTDVRLRMDQAPDDVVTALTVVGLIVSPHARTSLLGYERTGARSPWPIASFQHWRYRGSFLVRWSDIEQLLPNLILRPSYIRWSPMLDRAAVTAPGSNASS